VEAAFIYIKVYIIYIKAYIIYIKAYIRYSLHTLFAFLAPLAPPKPAVDGHSVTSSSIIIALKRSQELNGPI